MENKWLFSNWFSEHYHCLLLVSPTESHTPNSHHWLSPCWLDQDLKGTVHPKIKILSLITHPYVIPNPLDFRPSSEHKLRYFWWNTRAFWPCIDSNTIEMFKAQKGSKDIVKIIHASWYSRECASKTDTEEKEIVQWSRYFCFICAQKAYLLLHNITVEPLMSLLRFWALNLSVALPFMQGHKALGFHQK